METLKQIVTPSGLGLLVSKLGDRFATSIGWFNSAENSDSKDGHGSGGESSTFQVLLEAIEGNDQQDFPPSPPIQDYSIETRPSGAVLLAVGMAGTSHWSASVVADIQNNRLEFDIACRLKEPTEQFIGSTYRIINQDEFENRIRVSRIQGNVAVEANQLLVFPDSETGAKSGTVRWQFLLEASD